MNIQQLAVLLIFAGAILYLTFKSLNSFRKNQCSKGCAAGCGTGNYSKIEVKQ